MQQRYLYMKPALHPSEAVLLPALTRRMCAEPLPAVLPVPDRNDAFIPVTGDWQGQTTALSTRLRPGGSMAGRSVLRAAGISESPYRRADATGSRVGRRRMDRR